jgi:putative transcriptional regulator
MIRHHPEPTQLLDYAAGSQVEPIALVIASHLVYCAECRAEVQRLEALGGAMMHALAPAAVADDALERTLARIVQPATAPEPRPALDAETLRIVPPPLRPYLGRSLSELAWRRRTWSLEEARLDCSVPGYLASLVRLPAKSSFPGHSHLGREYTLVLSGSYADHDGHYRVGDLEYADTAFEHRLHTDDGCICLVVLDAGVQFKGLFGAMVNRFLPRRF